MYSKKKWKIYDTVNKRKLPNFDEDISENIVRMIITNIENKQCLWKIKNGDLFVDSKIKIEVKCFSSKSPSSFGPKERWDEIYFLDASNFINDIFICYKISLSNTHSIWENIKVNKTQTFKDQCNQNRRLRISFENIKNQIGDHIVELFRGDIKTLNNSKIYKSLKIKYLLNEIEYKNKLVNTRITNTYTEYTNLF